MLDRRWRIRPAWHALTTMTGRLPESIIVRFCAMTDARSGFGIYRLQSEPIECGGIARKNSRTTGRCLAIVLVPGAVREHPRLLSLIDRGIRVGVADPR